MHGGFSFVKVSHSMQTRTLFFSLFISASVLGSMGQVQAGTLFFSGDLRTNSTVIDCGSSCTLDRSTSTDGEFAQFSAYVTSFNVSSDSSVSAITFGYGGGTSGTGASIAAGGLEPYLSLFDASGNFLQSTFAGITCPTGAGSVGGSCFDVELDAGTLQAGTYQIALTAWENASYAENLGTGILGDGFTGLGNLGSGESLAFAFDVVVTPLTATPEPGTGLMLFLMAGVVAAGKLSVRKI